MKLETVLVDAIELVKVIKPGEGEGKKAIKLSPDSVLNVEDLKRIKVFGICQQ